MDAIYGLSDRQKATRWVVRLLVVFWAMFFAAPASAQTLAVSPTSLTWNPTAIPQGGSGPSKPVTITNNGTTTRTIGAINITGTNADSFTFTKTCGSSLSRRASCTVSVTFRPKATGPLSAVLNIQTNATNAPSGLFTVLLTGTGSAPAPVLSVSPTSLSFGSVGIGSSSGPLPVTVRNTGLGTMTSIAVSITGAGFTIADNSCVAPLAPTTGSCIVKVLFTAAAPAGAKSGRLTIATNGGTSNVTLSGNATTPTPVLTLSPTRLTLTCATPYGGPVTLPVTASNTGTAPLTLGNISFAGSGASYFSASKVACLGTLTPGAACNIAVTFSPTGKTSRSATMTVTATSTVATVASKSVSLTGSCRSHPSP